VDTTVLRDHIGFTWKSTNGKHLPKGAIVAGYDDGQSLYIARCDIFGEVGVGKYFPPHHCSYIPHGGGEHKFDNADILCCASKHVY